MSPLDESSRSDRGAETETTQAHQSGDAPADGSADGSAGIRADSEAGAGDEAPRRPQTALSLVRETAVLVVLAILLAVLFKTFLVQAFYIPSGSMEPTLNISDRVLVEKVSY